MGSCGGSSSSSFCPVSVGSAMQTAVLPFPSSGGDSSSGIFTGPICNVTFGAIISGNVTFKPHFGPLKMILGVTQIEKTAFL